MDSLLTGCQQLTKITLLKLTMLYQLTYHNLLVHGLILFYGTSPMWILGSQRPWLLYTKWWDRAKTVLSRSLMTMAKIQMEESKNIILSRWKTENSEAYFWMNWAYYVQKKQHSPRFISRLPANKTHTASKAHGSVVSRWGRLQIHDEDSYG